MVKGNDSAIGGVDSLIGGAKLENPVVSQKRSPALSFHDMVLGGSGGDRRVEAIPKLEFEVHYEDYVHTSSTCKPGDGVGIAMDNNGIIDMTVVEPEERYGPWMHVVGRKTHRIISSKGNVRGMSCGSIGKFKVSSGDDLVQIVSEQPIKSVSELEMSLTADGGSMLQGLKQRNDQHEVVLVDSPASIGEESRPHVQGDSLRVFFDSSSRGVSQEFKDVASKEQDQGNDLGKVVGSSILGSGSVSRGSECRLSRIKGVARQSPYPQRKKHSTLNENHNPNTVDIGEWISKTSKELTSPSAVLVAMPSVAGRDKGGARDPKFNRYLKLVVRTQDPNVVVLMETHLAAFKPVGDVPWALDDDFNDILSASERLGGFGRRVGACCHFSRFVHEAMLNDFDIPSPFKYFAAWHDDLGFVYMLKHSWSNFASIGTNMENFCSNARDWNRDVFGHICRRKSTLLARIRGIEIATEFPSNHSLLEREQQHLKNDLEVVLNQEEKLWFQRLRSQWICDGNSKTKYYHHATKLANVGMANSWMWHHDVLTLMPLPSRGWVKLNVGDGSGNWMVGFSCSIDRYSPLTAELWPLSMALAFGHAWQWSPIV
ncbi:hypothetical protein V6N13_147885 [Hibiscus sabdariffa]